MAMGMNAIKPALFSHVVLNDIGPVVAQEGLDRIKQYVGSASEFPSWEAAVEYTRTVNSPAFPEHSDVQWRQFAEQICSERGGKVVLDYDTRLSQPMKSSDQAAIPLDLWPLFDSLTAKPLMLVRGDLTDLLDMDCVDEMQRRHPNMVRLNVPNVGHAPMLDEPGVLERIIRFINSP